MNRKRLEELIRDYRLVERPGPEARSRMEAGLGARLRAGGAPPAEIDLPPDRACVPRSPPWLALGAGGALALALAVSLSATGDPETTVPSAGPPSARDTSAPLARAPAAAWAPGPIEATGAPSTEAAPHRPPRDQDEADVLEPPRARPQGTARKSHATRRASEAPAAPPAADPIATVDAEVRLIKRARAALRDGEASRALAILNAHARRFPHGAMAELRDVLRVDALCALGRSDAARSAARAFTRRYPDSLHGPKVAAGCND